MPDAYSLSRNTTEGFAQRVRKNLDFVVKKRNEGEDVHEVTQLVTSLLGVIIFPWEAGALRHLESLPLSELEAKVGLSGIFSWIKKAIRKPWVN